MAKRAGGQVAVPDVIGLDWGDAREVLRRAHLVAAGPDPEGPSLAGVGWFDGVVVAQRPEPSVMVSVGSAVTVWIERGPGSADVREPRRPEPPPESARGMVDEESGDAVG